MLWGSLKCRFPRYGSVLLLLLPAAAADPPEGWQFVDVAREAGIKARIISGTPEKKFLVETMGGGICVLDLENDGDPDLFFANGLPGPKAGADAAGDFLFENLGNGSFREVSAKAGLTSPGWGMGCLAGDYDNDGDADLYVTNFGANVLYQNQGQGRFKDVTTQAGVGHAGWSTGAAFGDYDQDGDLDLYVANYVEFDFENPGGDPRFCSYRGVTVACGPRGLPGAHDVLYRNEGNGSFTDVSKAAGIQSSDKLYGFQAMWTDIDEDGDLDVFVANDSTPNFLWVNQGDGTFTEEALLTGLAYNQEGRAQANMGVDIADFDGDGRLDLYSTNFSDDYNVLYRNLGDKFFQDQTFRAGISQITFRFLGFGTLMADFDNDGAIDILAANGHIYPEVEVHGLGSTYRQANQFFRGLGDGRFQEIGARLGPGLASVKSTRGAALLDFDRDGDLDLAISNLDEEVELLRNDLPSSNFLQVSLHGVASNRSGIGARIILETAGGKQVQELHAGSSFLGNDEPIFHFGLGQNTEVQRLTVLWPSGKKQVLEKLAANRRILIDEAKGLQ